jgi:hypothetical protein
MEPRSPGHRPFPGAVVAPLFGGLVGTGPPATSAAAKRDLKDKVIAPRQVGQAQRLEGPQ